MIIDFKEEVKKYKPVLEADALEDELELYDANDVMKLLHYLTVKPASSRSSFSYTHNED